MTSSACGPHAGLPRISVVIPCYNYAHFLPEAIDSVLRQTLPAAQILVVDDGSTDDTSAVVARYGDRVEYVWQVNGGLPAARNTGARHARGEYVVFLDADDMLETDYLRACAEALQHAPGEVAYAYTAMRYFGRREGVSHPPPFDIRSLRYDNYVHASAMLRRNVFERFRYCEDLRSLEDFDFYLTLAENGLRGVRVNAPLLLYRKHASMSDAMEKEWRQWHGRVVARHPALYPRRVELNMRLLRVAHRNQTVARGLWFVRKHLRELTSRR